jgi:hypothetical protein
VNISVNAPPFLENILVCESEALGEMIDGKMEFENL